jgi:hypothetical protein
MRAVFENDVHYQVLTLSLSKGGLGTNATNNVMRSVAIASATNA